MFNFKLFMYCRISQRWLFSSVIDIEMGNLKNNFIHLNNHEKKTFLERFVKEIKVRKEGNDVIIDEVIF